MRTTSKTYLALSLLLACGPISSGTTGTASTEPDDTSSSTSSTSDPTTSTSGTSTSTGDMTTGGPLCSPSAFCDSDDDCPETAHCSVFGVCATECDPTCTPECMTADPPCPAPCDKQCATGCTAAGECMLCEPGTGDPSTGEPACENVEDLLFVPEDAAAFCEANPFERPERCEKDMAFTCADVLGLMAASTKCDDLTVCDYQACADVLQTGACDERPAACDALVACLDIPQPGACCAENGKVMGTELCAVSKDGFCIDCNGEPTLCMEVCGPSGEPCCLSDAGETVPCSTQTSFCTIDFCDDFAEVALNSGLDPEFVDELGKICEWNPCFACNEVAKACKDSPCPPISEKCELEMQTCHCV